MTAILFNPVCELCKGDRKRVECGGTDISAHLNETDPKCRNCSGTGVCHGCNGTGLFGRDSGLDNL